MPESLYYKLVFCHLMSNDSSFGIIPENRKFFDIVSPADMDTQGFPYQHKSLMHFDSFKYSVNNQPTLKSKNPALTLGNKQALTRQDIQMINTLYTQCKCKYVGLCHHTYTCLCTTHV